jgi:5-(carboxyamino)imidazole ribonucleotide mutase
MKVFVVFGSKSDEYVANPLVEALSKTSDTEYQVISAHRDLDKLHETLSVWKGDAIVAGAGLAAALPGVVAAMTKLPVFGVPVPAQFGGMDAVCSIAQMPPGVPVMTAGPNRINAIPDFIAAYKVWDKKGDIHFVAAPDVQAHADFIAEVEKGRAIAADKGLTVAVSEKSVEGAFNIYMVTKVADVRPDAFGLHIPFMSKDAAKIPSNYLYVLEFMNAGGLWVGVNNTRNAIHSILRLKGI